MRPTADGLQPELHTELLGTGAPRRQPHTGIRHQRGLGEVPAGLGGPQLPDSEDAMAHSVPRQPPFRPGSPLLNLRKGLRTGVGMGQGQQAVLALVAEASPLWVCCPPRVP